MAFVLLSLLSLVLPIVAIQRPAGNRVLQVGPGREFSLPSQAAAVARDGDTVEIAAGTYTGDVAVWRASNLTIRGVGGRPHLRAGGKSAQDKAIWVTQGNNITIDNVELSGARVPDDNGAGIRSEGTGLTIRNCFIHDNQMGILAGGNQNSRIVIEYSEFARSDGDYNHNIYIGAIGEFTLQFSYIHHASHGHNVKSRAASNRILYNRIADEADGNSSYAVDLPNGGRSILIGNIIQKGVQSENTSVISYAEEGATNPLQELYLVNNTIVTEAGRGSFLQFGRMPSTDILNNVFFGRGVRLVVPGTAHHNLNSLSPGFLDERARDYRLVQGSPAIDAGAQPGKAGDFDLRPAFQYVHPMNGAPRNAIGPTDIGAFEWSVPK